MNFTIKDIADITGGKLTGTADDVTVTGAVRDNRDVTPGDMFCALRGERSDGHSFISDALDRGAACALAQYVPEGESRSVIVVSDVEAAMRTLATECRRRLNIPVVGVTGSVGKTTTKEMLAAVLSQRFNTLKTEKNYNNELGVPLTLFRIGVEHEAAVVELGISHFGEMTVLGEMSRPDIAVYTSIARSHLEHLGDRDGVLRAKAELLDKMSDDALVVVNGDDTRLNALTCRQNKLSYGLDAHNDVCAENVLVSGEDGSSFDIVFPDSRRISVKLAAYGRHLIYAALAAATVGAKLGLTDAEIANGIASYTPLGRRASVIKTPSLTIIDDCYNANPDSTAMAIASAEDLPGRLVCILGDMLELGENSEVFHRETGEIARNTGAALLTTGELSKVMGGEWFEDKAALISALPERLQRGDNVLVKASHSMAFEEIAEYLKTLEL